MELKFDRDEADGKLSLKTVNPLEAMEFTMAFLRALQAEAVEKGESLEFEGWELKEGSVRVLTRPTDERLARECERRVRALLRTGRIAKKPHLKTLVSYARRSKYSGARVKHRGRAEVRYNFYAVREVEDLLPLEVVTARVVFFQIGARNPTSPAVARFASVLTNDIYKLQLSHELEEKLAPAFRREMDITAEVTREGCDLSGELLGVQFVDDGVGLEALQRWFQESGAADAWARVTPEEYEREKGELWP